MIFEKNLPDIMFISKMRATFLPFINDIKMKKNSYKKIEDPNDKNFIFSYVRIKN